eukprot:6411486-Amphidinium_carterae.1
MRGGAKPVFQCLAQVAATEDDVLASPASDRTGQTSSLLQEVAQSSGGGYGLYGAMQNASYLRLHTIPKLTACTFAMEALSWAL